MNRSNFNKKDHRHLVSSRLRRNVGGDIGDFEFYRQPIIEQEDTSSTLPIDVPTGDEKKETYRNLSTAVSRSGNPKEQEDQGREKVPQGDYNIVQTTWDRQLLEEAYDVAKKGTTSIKVTLPFRGVVATDDEEEDVVVHEPNKVRPTSSTDTNTTEASSSSPIGGGGVKDVAEVKDVVVEGTGSTATSGGSSIGDLIYVNNNIENSSSSQPEEESVREGVDDNEGLTSSSTVSVEVEDAVSPDTTSGITTAVLYEKFMNGELTSEEFQDMMKQLDGVLPDEIIPVSISTGFSNNTSRPEEQSIHDTTNSNVTHVNLPGGHHYPPPKEDHTDTGTTTTTTGSTSSSGNGVVEVILGGNHVENHTELNGGGGGVGGGLIPPLLSSSTDSAGGGGSGGGQSPNDMLYFSLWYAALVLCCVIPSFVVYKRRRTREDRRLRDLRQRAERSAAALEANNNNNSGGNAENSLPPIHTDFPGWKLKIERNLKEEWALSSMVVEKKYLLGVNDLAAGGEDRSVTSARSLGSHASGANKGGRRSLLSRLRGQPPKGTKQTLQSLPSLDITTTTANPIVTIVEENGEDDEGSSSQVTGNQRRQLRQQSQPSSSRPFALDPSYIDPDGASLLTVEMVQMHNYDEEANELTKLNHNNIDDGSQNRTNPPTKALSDYEGSIGSLYSASGVVLRIPEKCPKKKKKLINGGPRVVPASCAICLDSYEVDDKIVWCSTVTNKNDKETKSTGGEKDDMEKEKSSSSLGGGVSCIHAFHETCIAMWCLRKIEENPRLGGVLCPCCRQHFVTIRREEDDSTAAVASTATSTTTPAIPPTNTDDSEDFATTALLVPTASLTAVEI